MILLIGIIIFLIIIVIYINGLSNTPLGDKVLKRLILSPNFKFKNDIINKNIDVVKFYNNKLYNIARVADGSDVSFKIKLDNQGLLSPSITGGRFGGYGKNNLSDLIIKRTRDKLIIVFTAGLMVEKVFFIISDSKNIFQFNMNIKGGDRPEIVLNNGIKYSVTDGIYVYELPYQSEDENVDVVLVPCISNLIESIEYINQVDCGENKCYNIRYLRVGRDYN